jgi:ATP-dependent helicase HepA
MIATCDRRRGLSREDVGFLTWDHPMITGAMDLLLGAETGNCAFAVLPTTSDRTVLLEVVFVLESIAAPHLHADRFLPPTPVRLLVNHKLVDVSKDLNDTIWDRKLVKGLPYKLIENAEFTHQTVPTMIEAATRLAETQAATLRLSALEEMNHLLDYEVERLQMLRLVNDHFRPQEIELAQVHQQELATYLQQSRLRLDALRLIWRGPPDALS